MTHKVSLGMVFSLLIGTVALTMQLVGVRGADGGALAASPAQTKTFEFASSETGSAALSFAAVPVSMLVVSATTGTARLVLRDAAGGTEVFRILVTNEALTITLPAPLQVAEISGNCPVTACRGAVTLFYD